MENMKPIEPRPASTGARVVEGYKNTTSNAKKSLIGALSYITIFSILFVAVAVFFTDVKMTDIKALTELSLTIAILWFCGYSIYFVTFDMGEKTAKKQKAYTEALTAYNSEKKTVKQSELKRYCEEYRTDELVYMRKSIVTSEGGIDYNTYEKEYLGKNKKELMQFMQNSSENCLTKQQIKAIVTANRLKPITLKAEHVLQEDKGTVRRSPLARSPKTTKTWVTVKKTFSSTVLAFFGGSVAFSLILDFSWATVVACLFKLLTIIVSACFGYKAGYNIIVDDTIKYITSQTDFLKGHAQWATEQPYQNYLNNSPDFACQHSNSTQMDTETAYKMVE